MFAYSKRRSRSDPAEQVWRIAEDALHYQDFRGVSHKTFWTDVVELSLTAAPLRFRPWRHVTGVTLRNGTRWDIDNAHLIGDESYEDKSPEYAPFIRGLVERVSVKAPYARVKRRSSFIAYLGVLAVMAVLLLMMAVMVLLIPTPGHPEMLLVKLVLLLFFTPALWMWLSDLRPRGLRVTHLPDSIFPNPEPAPVPHFETSGADDAQQPA